MLLVWFLLFRSVENYFVNSLETSLSYDVRITAKLWESYFANPQSLSMREKRIINTLTDGLTWQSASRITIFDKDGKVVMDTGNSEDLPPERGTLLEKALYGQETSQIFRDSPAIGTARISVCCPIKILRGSFREETAGAVFATSTLVYVKEIMSVVRREFGAGTLLSLFVMVVLSTILAGFIANPLRKITKAAEKMASGDLTTSVKMDRGDEIGELSRQFDNMRDKLQTTVRGLLDEEKKLHDVLSHMSDGVIVFSPEGNVMMANSVACSFLECFTIEELNENMKKDLPAFRELNQLLEKAINNKYQVTQNMHLENLGTTVKMVCSTLRKGNNELQGVIFLLHDITELSKLDEMRVDFVSNVSHELKTPLASIKGFTELLLDGALEDKEKARHFISSVNAEADRLARLVKSLLELSRLDSGMVKLEYSWFDLSILAKDILSRLSVKSNEKNITVEQNIEENINIYSDSDRLQQVIINLTDNAIRYSPQDSKILIRIFSSNGFSEFHVLDEGPGISKEDKSRIFERFYRVDKARSREQGGSGLGLAIVKQIVETLGGKVWAGDNEPKGSYFAFRLPLDTSRNESDEDDEY